MLHLTKLAVGIRDVPHLREAQAKRLAATPPLRVTTRSFPKRASEVLAGGSLFWVIAGATAVRQRVLDITEERRADGTRGTLFVVDPALVVVSPRLSRPFQGWRYLPAAEAPPDLDATRLAEGEEALPEHLLRDLRLLGLL